MKGRRARSQTYLVKELVLGQVPDVPRLVHGRKTRGNTESPLVVMDALQVLLLFSWLSAPMPLPLPSPGQPRGGPPLSCWSPSSHPAADVVSGPVLPLPEVAGACQPVPRAQLTD